MPSSPHPRLSADAINRATLARQLLLERASVPLPKAIERLAGLQAQEPASPYLALWTRLREFRPEALDKAFRDRRVVKASLMRSTLHAVTVDDYRHFLPAIQPMLRSLNRRASRRPNADRIAELADAAAAFASEPRSNVELRDHVASLDEAFARDVAWWFIHRHAAFVNVPTDAVWSFGRRPAYVAADAWLDGLSFASEDAGLERLVRRYLGAFGPASAADASAWSGLPIARLRPAIAAIDAAGDIERFSDDRGRELLDLRGAPHPPADVAAPARLLPMWDSLLLAHADRTRVVADEHRRTVIAKNGDTLPTFLVDGRVAGLWWAESDGTATTVVLEPFGRLRRADRRALEDEAERLAEFVGPLEPEVYRRYRWSRARVR